MKKMIIPALVVLLGTSGAFASKVVKSRLAIVDGYHIDAVSGQCITDGQQCSTSGVDPCRWSENSSVELKDAPDPSDLTECGEQLFRQ